MIEKPRFRVQAGDATGATASSYYTKDGFENLEAKIGVGPGYMDNAISQSQYGLNPITRNRLQLEFAYRGSWICREVIDAIPDDMTREGIDFTGEITKDPSKMEELQSELIALNIMDEWNTGLKWSRLYGGAILVILIDGQRLDTPLRPETVGKGQFKGLLPMDRWLIRPTREDLIMDYGPTMGLPEFYQVVVPWGALPQGYIHSSRCIRLEGINLPFFQRLAEYGWGCSVLEPLWDRLVAFDSATLGAAQLVFKAYLRTMKIDGLRGIIAQGGKMLDAVTSQLSFIKRYQSNEGLTVIDGKDELEAQGYQFAGISDIIEQLAHQLCGAAQIPYVRLFGDSPGGLNSPGDGELANYYDKCHSDQECHMRPGMGLVMNLLFRSKFGKEPPKGFNFAFKPLYQQEPDEKAATATAITGAVTTAFEKGVIGRGTALKELKASSEETGVFGSITDEEIAEAEEEGPPDPMGDQLEMMNAQAELESEDTDDSQKANNPKQRKGGKSQTKSKSTRDFRLSDLIFKPRSR